MKTTRTISATIINTISLKAVVFTILFSVPFLSFGQLVKAGESYSFNDEPVIEYKLTSFKANYIQGKVYIMFSVLEPSNECTYVVESSTDNIKYKMLYATNGIKSPANMELSNSFTDMHPLNDITYYRIRRITSKGSTLSSALIVNMPNLNEEISTIKNNTDIAKVN